MSDLEPGSPRKIVVPGPPPGLPDDEQPQFDGLVNAQDLGSASRSCLAIIVVLLIIGVLLCVFLIGAVVM
ncbi:MAG: hypothetical protein H0U31_00085 [Chloroflexia bacterium]|jgi:hypothetical protein|nr:hypothetical protein [Chloroflexia bacterium]